MFSRDLVPPIIIIYTDGGPEHRTNFLSVKIAIISLQKSLNCDMVLALRTAPGSSYRNPSERVNCKLNVGLYGIGVMRKHVFDNLNSNESFPNVITSMRFDNLLNKIPL